MPLSDSVLELDYIVYWVENKNSYYNCMHLLGNLTICPGKRQKYSYSAWQKFGEAKSEAHLPQ